jgi:hypothetical protein
MLMGWTEASWADDVNTSELAERRAQPISKPVESAEKEKKAFCCGSTHHWLKVWYVTWIYNHVEYNFTRYIH